MDPKALLLKHFEKLICGLFGVWLAITLVGFTSPPPELKSNEKISEELKKIEDYMGKTRADVTAQQDVVTQLKASVSSESVRPVDAKSMPAWLAHRRPNLAFVVEGGPARPQPVHSAPTDFTGVAERGRVKLTWQPADATQNAYIIIDGYEVQRREIVAAGEPPAWSSLATLKRDPTQQTPPTEWLDEKVQPRKKYEYKLIETAILDEDNQAIRIINQKAGVKDDEKVKFPDLPRAPAEREVTWAMEKDLPRDLYIVPAPGSVVIPPPAEQVKGTKPTVTLKVYKFDPKSNGFVEKQYFSKPEGTKNIGQMETVRGQKIDFSTGAELIEVRQEEREVQIGGQKVTKPIGIIKIKWPGIDQPEEIDEVNLPEEISPKKPEKPATPPKSGAPATPGGGGK
jgi:hypothetical protein